MAVGFFCWLRRNNSCIELNAYLDTAWFTCFNRDLKRSLNFCVESHLRNHIVSSYNILRY